MPTARVAIHCYHLVSTGSTDHQATEQVRLGMPERTEAGDRTLLALPQNLLRLGKDLSIDQRGDWNRDPLLARLFGNI